jgi:hypothetical protein
MNAAVLEFEQQQGSCSLAAAVYVRCHSAAGQAVAAVKEQRMIHVGTKLPDNVMLDAR